MPDAALFALNAKPIAILADDLRVTFANAPLAAVFDTPPADLDALDRLVRAEPGLCQPLARILPRLATPGRTAAFRWTTGDAAGPTYLVHLVRLPDGGVLALFDEISGEELSGAIQSATRRYLEEIVNHLDRAVLVVDAGLRATFMNVAQQRLLARIGNATPWVDLVGAHVADVYPVVDRAAWHTLCDDAVACGTIGEGVRVRAATARGALWLDLRAVPLGQRADDGGGGALVITDDVTRLVALEGAAMASARREWVAQLALSLNHDINNPLTAILGAAETLRADRELDAAVLARVDVVRAGALRIADVIRRLEAVEAQGDCPDAHDPAREQGAATPRPDPDR